MGSGKVASSGTQLVHSAASGKNLTHHFAFPQQNLNEATNHFLPKGHNPGVLKHLFTQNFINPNKSFPRSNADIQFSNTQLFFAIKGRDLYFQIASPTWNGKAGRA